MHKKQEEEEAVHQAELEEAEELEHFHETMEKKVLAQLDHDLEKLEGMSHHSGSVSAPGGLDEEAHSLSDGGDDDYLGLGLEDRLALSEALKESAEHYRYDDTNAGIL